MRAVIVGAGIAGLTAGVLLKRNGWAVDILDVRTRPGGNCDDKPHEGGYHVHTFGPHIFHTDNTKVWRFITQFTGFNGYQHQVMARTELWDPNDCGYLPVPYNQCTSDLLDRELSDDEIREAFFRVYTEKMWGTAYDKVPKEITGRVPLRRDNRDCRYFRDPYQGMPAGGYHAMFRSMCDAVGPDSVHLGVKRDAWKEPAQGADLIVYTGPLDELLNHKYGHLPYRALEFVFRHKQSKLPRTVVNDCTRWASYTRLTDYSHFYSTSMDWDMRGPTTIGVEYPQDWDPQTDLVPSYPMRGFPGVDDLVARYEELAAAQANLVLCGRLGTYKYMNMDATILDTMHRLDAKLGKVLYA